MSRNPTHTPKVLIEPFCGMAALSFALMGCQPPIRWMGQPPHPRKPSPPVTSEEVARLVFEWSRGGK